MRAFVSAVWLAATMLLLTLVADAYGRPASADASGFTVNAFIDVVDAAPGDGVCQTATAGQCTLRAAIQEANALPGADTITLPAGTYPLSIPGTYEDAGATGDLDITDALTVAGTNVYQTFIDGSRLDRVLDVRADATVSGVTIRDGDSDCCGGGVATRASLTLIAADVSDNISGAGAGVYNRGSLSITNSSIRRNRTVVGGVSLGGGILNEASASLVVTDSVISDNTTDGYGGGVVNSTGAKMDIVTTFIERNSSLQSDGAGIYNNGDATIRGSRIAENANTYGGGGGGIYNGYGTLDLRESSVFSNSTGILGGGGVANHDGGTATLTDDVISDNSSISFGGGVLSSANIRISNTTITRNRSEYQTYGIGGGAIFEGTATLENVTISGNTTVQDGGGVYVASGTLTSNNVTIADNTADADGNGSGDGGGIFAASGSIVKLANTVVGGNTDNERRGAPDCAGAVESQGFNLIAETGGCTLAGDLTGVITGRDARLGPLRPNPPYGAPARYTHAPLWDSPALEAGSPAVPGSAPTACTSTDERGISRPQNARCDIGAFEFDTRDDDGDGMPNDFERMNGCVQLTTPDANVDYDGDTLSSIAEYAQTHTDPCVRDTDRDRCSDGEEAGADPLLGGDRDPNSPWDFFDVRVPALTAADPSGQRNGAVTLADARAILWYVGTVDNRGANATGVDYDSDLNYDGVEDGREYDRAPSLTAGKPWRSAAPNDAVTLQDVLVALAQVGATCHG